MRRSDLTRHATKRASVRRGAGHLVLRAAVLALAGCLGIGVARAATAEPTFEQQLEAADPTLYAAARKYFPGDAHDVSPKRVFRLTRDQIDATAAALLPGYKIPSIKTLMPRDPLQTNFEYAELLSFNAANIGPLSQWIGEVAAKVKENPAGVVKCPGAKPAAECLAREMRLFVTRAFRGDVNEKRLEEFEKFYLAGVERFGHAQATADLVEVVLNSPSFLFRKDIAGRRGAPSPEQDLQAITYTLADSPPEVFRLSSADALLHVYRPEDVAATVELVLAAKETREKLVRFFNAWLEVKEPGEMRISREVFKEFTDRLASAMTEETNRFLRTQLSKPAPKLKDITQAGETYISKPLEEIYRKPVADAAGSRPVKLDPAQRFGIFSQPAVLASHSGPTSSQPIKRGVFWVRKVMCMELDAPPAGVDVTVYELEGKTERERIEAVTSKKACIGCHRIIDPFGFVLENYDALGRWRTTDHGAPIDASIQIDFLDEEPKTVNGPVEALKTLTGSVMFKQCFVRQLFRFYMGRQEEPTDDPLLRRMFLEFAHNDEQDILKIVRLLATSDRVVRRRPA